ncbi:hypothetical protein [Fluviicola sp.]|uniref:hypothetical protein n=1 Tax=Fluviicola sp. TaxID=1917219 RepID=UPI0031D2B07B
MYLFTKLSKRTKTISWFLLHVFVLQIIPFSSFAGEKNSTVDLNLFTASGNKKSDLIARMLAWSAPSSKENTESDSEYQSLKKVNSPDSNKKNSVQLKTVSASGSGFTPGAMNDMVDPFTGDFSYNLPLMDVEGYPLTLTYNANVNMNSDASWVGLGWNLDVGSVNREMRGIPDEFNGDQNLTRTVKQLDDITSNGFKAGGYASLGLKKNYFTPKLQVTALWGSYENSYLGLGKTFDIGLQATVALSYSDERGNIAASFGLGYTSDTKGGVGFNRDFGFSAGYGPKQGETGAGGSIGATFGRNFNSRIGLIAKTQSFSVSAGYTAEPYKGNADSDKWFTKGDKGATTGRGYSASYGASTTIMFGTAASTPRLQFNSTSLSNAFFLNAYVGAKSGSLVAKAGAIVETYSSESKMAGSNTIYEQAYGYLHSGKRANATGSSPVMDFNRGTDFEFSERMKNLPFSVQTYDIFHASSSGINGQFRANRTDVGTYYDASTQGRLNENSVMLVNDDIKAVNVGVLFGAGITIEVGYSTGVQKGDMVSGKWGSPIDFATVGNNTEYDPTTYFKAIGELTPNNLANYTNLGGSAPRRFNLTAGSDINVTSTMDNGISPSVSSSPKPVRATAFIPRTANAMYTGSNVYERTFRYYNTTGTYVSPVNRVGAHRAGNHISAIQVTSTNGGIYTYGIPNYSLISSEVAFSCTGRSVDASTGMVSYSASDASISNSLGKSQMFDRTDIPAYPTTFLLTSSVSSDYIDVTGDGPSLDDIGSYYKFDYVKVYDNYKWRFPVSGYGSGNPKAIINKGFLSLDSDDIASYSYGEREVYYPKTIKGKNYIAVFVLEDRKDAFGVIDDKGFLDDTKPLKALDKIILYNLSDYEANGVNATMLQVVDFEYDYSLCLKAPSNKDTYTNPSSTNNGKLTLKKIMTYAGTSKEQGLSAIEFDYNAGPSYNHLNVDRWGNYKPNNTAVPNDLYPYAIQDETTANTYSAYWKLSKVTSSTGGEMTINYEADSYGYVQNKRAMRQFEIAGMMNLYKYHEVINQTYWTSQSSDLKSEFRNDSFNPNPDFVVEQFRKKYGEFKKNLMPNNVIVFRLDKPISNSLSKVEANKKVKDDYFKDPSKGPNSYLQELYFNVYAEVKSGYQEMIPCFVKIAPDYPQLFQDWSGGMDNNMYSIGVLPPSSSTDDYQYGYVVLELINVGKIEETKKKEKKDKDILILHPIQRFGIDFIRQNLPDIVYGACRTCEGELSVDKKALFGNEMYEYIITKGNYLRNLTTTRSFVRLFEPDNKKFGGNARVKSIQIDDKWVSMSGEESITNGTYGWTYQYPSRSETGGIAAYEPRQGMDENPFYEWDSYYDFAKKFPDELNFNVMPLAQQLFPKEVVGYEKVRISMTGYGASSKGEVEMNFHTNKEEGYKTIAVPTDIDKSQKINEKSFFTGQTVDLYGFSQGYSVITNDFHGKPIDITLKDPQGNSIYQTVYEYYKLGEKIPMIDRKGHVENESVAQEYDIHLDSRYIHDESKFKMAGLTVGFTWSLPPKISISPFYTQNSRERGFYSLNMLKHMNYSAVVKSIKTTNMASENTANNLLYDKYTGSVILSSLQDEYNDRLYSLVYPAHWAYPNLREIQTSYPASSSGNLNSSTGLLTATYDLSEFYSPGDLIELTNGSTTSTGYILSIAAGSSGSSTAYIVNTNGAIFTAISGALTFRVLVPNRSNRLSEAMQTLATKKPFVITAGSNFPFPTDEILESSALIYKDKNNISECSPKPDNQYINLFANGAKGKPIVETILSWQTERKNEVHPQKTRFDGAYVDFKPLYALDAYNVWARIDRPNYPSGNGTFQKWRKSAINTRFNRYGVPIESRDLIGNYSTTVSITNTKIADLQIAQVSNANATDIAFDGFETYTYETGFYGTYFNFQIPSSTSLVSTVRHSGKTSLKLTASQSASYTSTTTANCAFDEIPSTDIPAGYLDGRNCNCPPPLFNPNPGDYIFGAWVKQTGTNATVKVIVGTGGSATTYTAVKSGPAIDGWQRVEGICTIPTAPIQVSLKLENGTSTDAYFDDFRLHPVSAEMSTIVYDPKTLLPLATHNTYNYTTFYNYDENLQLVRLKLETIEGIKTVSETESGLYTK